MMRFLNKMAVKITYFVHGTTTDNEESISSGWKLLLMIGARQNHGDLAGSII